MRWATVAVVAGVGLLMAVPASGRSVGTLSLQAVFTATVTGTDCPHGTPSTTACYSSQGTALVRGLGSVTATFGEAVADNGGCTHTTFGPAVLAVEGKGDIDATLTDAYTCDPDVSSPATDPFTTTGGTGRYANASGSGTLTFSNFQPTGSTSARETHTWAGQVSAATDFDTTPPTIAGTHSLVVKTKKRSVRVHFAPTATDSVDGSVPVACLPKSGSSFSAGKTTVTCTATDSSDNTATAHFTVKVKRGR
jgi:hypothetical protein